MHNTGRRYFVAVLISVIVLCAVSLTYGSVPNFTFIHISDEHSGAGKNTSSTLAELAALSSVRLEPYGCTAQPPSFIVETGDMTEFGRSDAFDYINKMYAACKLAVYPSLGNHDCTWRPLSYELTKAHGGRYYSFDECGCHFVMLDTAGLQDPRPTIGPEELEWLQADLARVGKSRPIFVGFHHPLGCTEYSSTYETDRLVDILHQYNVALLLVGHGHSARYDRYDGLDMVEGGSAYGPDTPGFQVVSIADGKLRVAYKDLGKPTATIGMLEKPLADKAPAYPAINVQFPKESLSYGSAVTIKAWVGMAKDSVADAYALVDGKTRVDLSRETGGSFGGEIDAASLQAGAHFLRLCFADRSGALFHHSTVFYTDSASGRVLWRRSLGAASKSTPVRSGNLLFAGTNDGRLHAVSVANGKTQWAFRTGGAVVCQPLCLLEQVIFGSEDGFLYSVSARDGRLIWRFCAGEPIYSAPVSDGSLVYFGCRNGSFYCISASDGKLLWKNTDASYNIECKPLLSGGRVYFGCWDTYLYCVDASTGTLIWKCVGQGSSEGLAPAYYSPAKCSPVVCRGKVFVADRKYRLSIIDSGSGKIERYLTGVSSVGLSADGTDLYLRKLDGKLAKVDAEGHEIWSTPASMDDIVAAPVESNGVVYVCSGKGLVSALSADKGMILWQYKATPSSFVLSIVGTAGDNEFVSGTDGSLTVLKR